MDFTLLRGAGLKVRLHLARFRSCRHRHHLGYQGRDTRIIGLAASHEPVAQILVLLFQQRRKLSTPRRNQVTITQLEKAQEEVIELQHPAPALPAQTADLLALV